MNIRPFSESILKFPYVKQRFPQSLHYLYIKVKLVSVYFTLALRWQCQILLGNILLKSLYIINRKVPLHFCHPEKCEICSKQISRIMFSLLTLNKWRLGFFERRLPADAEVLLSKSCYKTSNTSNRWFSKIWIRLTCPLSWLNLKYIQTMITIGLGILWMNFKNNCLTSLFVCSLPIGDKSSFWTI